MASNLVYVPQDQVQSAITSLDQQIAGLQTDLERQTFAHGNARQARNDALRNAHRLLYRLLTGILSSETEIYDLESELYGLAATGLQAQGGRLPDFRPENYDPDTGYLKAEFFDPETGELKAENKGVIFDPIGEILKTLSDYLGSGNTPYKPQLAVRWTLTALEEVHANMVRALDKNVDAGTEKLAGEQATEGASRPTKSRFKITQDSIDTSPLEWVLATWAGIAQVSSSPIVDDQAKAQYAELTRFRRVLQASSDYVSRVRRILGMSDEITLEAVIAQTIKGLSRQSKLRQEILRGKDESKVDAALNSFVEEQLTSAFALYGNQEMRVLVYPLLMAMHNLSVLYRTINERGQEIAISMITADKYGDAKASKGTSYSRKTPQILSPQGSSEDIDVERALNRLDSGAKDEGYLGARRARRSAVVAIDSTDFYRDRAGHFIETATSYGSLLRQLYDAVIIANGGTTENIVNDVGAELELRTIESQMGNLRLVRDYLYRAKENAGAEGVPIDPRGISAVGNRAGYDLLPAPAQAVYNAGKQNQIAANSGPQDA
jgi:hypothetical protein